MIFYKCNAFKQSSVYAMQMILRKVDFYTQCDPVAVQPLIAGICRQQIYELKFSLCLLPC